MSSMTSVRRTVFPLLVLALLALILPIRSTLLGTRSTTVECLTLTAHPPHGADPALIAVYERCVALEPDDVALLGDLAALYEETQDAGHAEALYRRALALDGGAADLRLRLGRLMLNRGDAVGARREAEAALGVRPASQAALDLRRVAIAGGAAAHSIGAAR